MNAADIRTGRSWPIGATIDEGGVNFSVYSRSAEAVELLLFDDADQPAPARVVTLTAPDNRTFHYWHVFVSGIGAGQVYGYRAAGPYAPDHGGLRFDRDKLLLDPYGRAVAVPQAFDRWAAARPGDTAATAMRSVVADVHAYDWQGDLPLRRSFEETVIYEMHVRGFTRHPSSSVTPEVRGTYRGLIEKIPYLVELGVTAVELMPVFQFDPQEAPPGLVNYWGYNPVSLFAPHVGYAASDDPLAVLDEFRDMVKALHRAGIEIILDVVYNHTAEGDERGPTFCFKGFGNPTYYILEPDRRRYANFSGTGNTLNANHAIVRRLILDSLRYWVEEMHVDGFRFDLAAILSRDENGLPLPNPPILWDIETDPVLAGTKLIAEAWDASGLYQVGSFVGDHWKEWNGRFRDDVRALVKGDAGMVPKVAARFLASPDLYGDEGREPEQSINFVTCHDGFTLNDLVSYDRKHNEANGEGDRDGSDHNLSWNCGVEGPSDDAAIESLRERQIKNLLVINFLALGVPMLLMGDEVRRSQQGNNNAYCQDNELSWFDWTLLERSPDLLRFTRELIRFRRSRTRARRTDLTLTELLQHAEIRWHGTDAGRPDWRYDSRSLAFTAGVGRERYHVIVNAYWDELEFALPANRRWRRVIDTAVAPPDDLILPRTAPTVEGRTYRAEGRSVVVLVAGGNGVGEATSGAGP